LCEIASRTALVGFDRREEHDHYHDRDDDWDDRERIHGPLDATRRLLRDPLHARQPRPMPFGARTGRCLLPSMAGMVRTTTPLTAVEQLAGHLLDRAGDDAFIQELTGWLAGSARFRAFAEVHRDKIRKKLRTAADAEALRDVRAELQAARLLLADPRIELAFEAYGSGKVGPDLTVTYRGRRSFNLEVTRLRRVPDATDFGPPLLAKLRQLPPSVPNAVLVAIGGRSAEALDVAAATRALRSRADTKDETFFARRGLEGARDFYERYLRLGGVLVWCEGSLGDTRAALWVNRSARIPLPERDIRAVVRCLRKDA